MHDHFPLLYKVCNFIKFSYCFRLKLGGERPKVEKERMKEIRKKAKLWHQNPTKSIFKKHHLYASTILNNASPFLIYLSLCVHHNSMTPISSLSPTFLVSSPSFPVSCHSPLFSLIQLPAPVGSPWQSLLLCNAQCPINLTTSYCLIIIWALQCEALLQVIAVD